MDPTETTAFDPTLDISSQLLQRYSSSSAPQHRHLTATAAAVKSLLLEDSLPLSPLSYFAAVMTALSQPLNDAAAASALATLLSIVLPLVPEGSISSEKAADATAILIRVSKGEEREMVVGSASSARCVVKSLGVLLGFCDLGDWNSFGLGFGALLDWCMDKRPKVRKCALVYLENGLKSLQSKSMKKKASKLIMSLLESHMSVASKLGMLDNGGGSESHYEAEQSNIVHALYIVRVAFPYLSDESSKLVILKLIKLVTPNSSPITRPVLNVIEVFLEKDEVGIVSEVIEDIIDALSSYVFSKTNPKDSVISAANLLKISLDKIRPRDIGKWVKSFSIAFRAIAGLLTLEDDIASKSSIILKNIIVDHLPDVDSQKACDFDKNDEGQKAIGSICSTFVELLDSCDGIPSESILAVLSLMFLKLGHSSISLARNIILKLANILDCADGKTIDTSNLEACFGCAVVSLGAENILSLVPITFDTENSTYKNMWMLPILKNYTCGSSLGCFMEHIVPVAQSLQKASRKVKSVIGQDLQAHAMGLWGLLPSFCRYPMDITKSFESFTKLILTRLKKNAFLHEDIAKALQELIIQNKCLSERDGSIIEPIKHKDGFSLEDLIMEKKKLHCYSKKAATKNIKVLSKYSDELLLALITIFLDSTPEKRSSLKKAIGCLASITNSSVTKKIFMSSLERFPVVKASSLVGDSDPSNSLLCDVPLESSSIDDNSQWSLILDLGSSIVEGADDELLGVIFRFTKIALQAGNSQDVAEAYNTLSCVLEAHPTFFTSQMDTLVDFMIDLKTPVDIASFNNRLNCLHLFLIHALKSSSDVENTKPFLILNEIIVALKDSREEARKTAYDILLKISSCLEDPSSTNRDGPYYRLISMILGYLSGPSPHITSAAVSALSVLVFKDPKLCLRVPDVVSSVSSLLHSKAVETIKAVLGFIKVLVSCLEAKDLQNIVQDIMDGVLPWSSVSRHHFRSKVTVILEILIRKLGLPAIKFVTPERFHSFIRKVSQNHHGKTTSKEADSSDKTPQLSDDLVNGPKKRSRKETNGTESGLNLHKNKKRKLVDDSQSRGRGNTRRAFDKKTSDFKHRKSNFHQNKKKGQKFEQSNKSTQMRYERKNSHKERSKR